MGEGRTRSLPKGVSLGHAEAEYSFASGFETAVTRVRTATRVLWAAAALVLAVDDKGEGVISIL